LKYTVSVLFASFSVVFFSPAARAQEDPEKSKLEITASWWPVNTSGTIRANGTPIDLKSDLGVNQGQATFTGKLVGRFSRRNKIVVEGTPFHLEGASNLSRTITYQGRDYLVNDHVTSTADMTYFYGGYQFDLLSRPSGHLGLEVGGAYLSASGSLTSQTANVTENKTETIGLPLAGAEFRVFPVHRRLDIEINGEVRGMKFGSYGYYVQASANAGIGIGPILVEGGYRIVNFDIHTTNAVDAVSPQFTGPVVSLVFRVP
jgi:hypothetical protein